MARWKIFAMGCLASLLVHAAVPALAADAAAGDATPAKKAKKSTAGKQGKLIVPEGSGETAAARSARLRRECKGRPNAGACTGHTD